jgi:hypothetical protein
MPYRFNKTLGRRVWVRPAEFKPGWSRADRQHLKHLKAIQREGPPALPGKGMGCLGSQGAKPLPPALQVKSQAVLWRDHGAGRSMVSGVAEGDIDQLYNNQPLESKSRAVEGVRG